MRFKPRRFKSIDIFRGTCMVWMFLGHLLDWWLKPEFSAIRDSAHILLDSVGASGFLFISGVSIALSYKNQMYRVNSLKTVSYFRVKVSYFIRSFLLLIIALLYNLIIAIVKWDFSWIWTWFVLMTAAFSLMIIWPLFKVPLLIRAVLVFVLWLLSNFLYYVLSPFKGNSEIYGVFYYMLFNPYEQDPLINFFSFFLFGTIIGEILSYSNYEPSFHIVKQYLNKRFIKPFLLIGAFFIAIGILFYFPNFLIRSSLSWLIYSLGIEITFLVILLFLEENGFLKLKRSYNLLFYYSYYSFTVYLAHNLLIFICSNCLNLKSTFLAIFITFIVFGLILRKIYHLWGWKASIKSIIGNLSTYLAKKIETKRN